MTAKTKAPKAPSLLPNWGGAALADAPFLSWLAGVGLNRGFGVHVPFIAGWLLLAALFTLVYSLASVASNAYHREAIKATPLLAAADTATSLVTEHETQRLLDAKGLLDMDSKLRGK